MKLYRQGDLVLRECPIPAEAIDITPADGVIVLAKGSASAHQHVFDSEHVRLFEHETERFVKVVEDTPLQVVGDTQRHEALLIAAREYKVIGQQGYTPQAWRDIND